MQHADMNLSATNERKIRADMNLSATNESKLGQLLGLYNLWVTFSKEFFHGDPRSIGAFSWTETCSLYLNTQVLFMGKFYSLGDTIVYMFVSGNDISAYEYVVKITMAALTSYFKRCICPYYNLPRLTCLLRADIMIEKVLIPYLYWTSCHDYQPNCVFSSNHAPVCYTPRHVYLIKNTNQAYIHMTNIEFIQVFTLFLYTRHMSIACLQTFPPHLLWWLKTVPLIAPERYSNVT